MKIVAFLFEFQRRLRWDNSRLSLGAITVNLILVPCHHYSDVIMGAMASQITSLTIDYSIVNSGTDKRKHQRSASLAGFR